VSGAAAGSLTTTIWKPAAVKASVMACSGLVQKGSSAVDSAGDHHALPDSTRLKIAMGQAHVRRWTADLMPLVSGEDDPLGVEDLCTHRLPLEDAPRGYEIFQKKLDGAIKVVLQP
jgi:threonine dehydrogenase-like Zn-dependent dehydrogenase